MQYQVSHSSWLSAGRVRGGLTGQVVLRRGQGLDLDFVDRIGQVGEYLGRGGGDVERAVVLVAGIVDTGELDFLLVLLA